jgi:hypothetical protein
VSGPPLWAAKGLNGFHIGNVTGRPVGALEIKMSPVTLAILLAILAGVMVLYYMSEREKNAVKRKKRRRFRPQWTRDSARRRDRRKKSQGKS